MRVAIVGAGISGLAAARELSRRGIETTVFESSDTVGGRVCSRVESGYIADYGAQFVTPRGLRVEKLLLDELPQDELVEITRPVYLLDGGRPTMGSRERNSQKRYTYRNGFSTLPKLMAVGVEIRLGRRVSELKSAESGFVLDDECYDSVILAGAMPDIQPILTERDDRRSNLAISYRPCLSVSLGFSSATPEVPYFGLLASDRRSPVLWLGIENLKCPDRAPSGHTLITAQFGPEYSADYIGTSDARLIQTVEALTKKLFGEAFGSHGWAYVHHWQHSQPERVALFENINPEGTRLVVAGDGTVAGRIENAYESGLYAADHVAKLLS